MATFTVTTTADTINDDGETSLREAIASANAAVGRDTIVFASNPGEAFETGGTIVLNGTALKVTDDVSIDGDLNGRGSPQVRIDADLRSRVLEVEGTSLSLNGLTITGGQSAGNGGGIYLSESQEGVVPSLLLNASVVSNNIADGNGGGVGVEDRSGSIITVENSLFSFNRSAENGGGLANDRSGGSLFIELSTFYRNSAGENGGGVYDNSYGFAGPESDPTVGIRFSTITGNSAGNSGGGVFRLSSNEDVTTSASPEGVRIFDIFQTYEIDTSIIAGNSAPDSPNFNRLDQVILNNRTNIFDDVDLADVFDEIVVVNGVETGVLAEVEGGVRSVALLASEDNPALDRVFGKPDAVGLGDLGSFELQSLALDDDTNGDDTDPLGPNASSPGVRVVSSNGENEVVRGTAGDDVVRGGAGDDYLLGLAGADVLDGGEGFDTAAYSESRTGVTIDLTDLSQNAGDAAGDTYQSIEAFRLSEQADVFRGDIRTEDQLVFAGGGDDELSVARLSDARLYGQAGNDVLTFGELQSGGSGDDVLVDGEVSFGGAGADRFVFTVQEGSGGDISTIRDFEQGIDIIDLSAFEGRGFEDLTIVAATERAGELIGSNIRIEAQDEDFSYRIFVQNLTPDQFTEDDFVF